VVPPPNPATSPLPLYWYRPSQALARSAGMHRFAWDVHYQPLAGGGGGGGGLPSTAVPYNTAPAPTTPWVAPGVYTVKLTVNGKSYTTPITVKADPRVKTAPAVLQQVYSLSRDMYFGAVDIQTAAAAIGSLRGQVAARRAKAQGSVADRLAAFDKKAEALQASPQASSAPLSSAPLETLAAAGAALRGVMNSLQEADVRPTAIQLAAIARAQQLAARVTARWNALAGTDLAALNGSLTSAGLEPVIVK
jgi:hypothetical protein